MINNLKNDVERHHFQNTSLSCLGINLEKSLKHCFFYTFFKCATDTATKSTFTQSLNHTNLNCRSHGPLEQPQPAVPYTKVQNSIERDSTNYAPLSGYSTISNVLQIGVRSPQFLRFIKTGLKYKQEFNFTILKIISYQ